MRYSKLDIGREDVKLFVKRCHDSELIKKPKEKPKEPLYSYMQFARLIPKLALLEYSQTSYNSTSER